MQKNVALWYAMGKVSGFVLGHWSVYYCHQLLIGTKITKSGDLGIWVLSKCYQTARSNENCLLSVSKHLIPAMSATNCVIVLRHTY